MLQLLFGVRLNWLPISGRIDPVIGTTIKHITNLYAVDALITGNWPAFISVARTSCAPHDHVGADPIRRIRAHDPHQRDRNPSG